ncbi:MAG TPA: hypothetical protein VFX16_32230 [Pseudonocardiaceae bacterium]|nr:hypothetical protein [Pseudonocardiaceae bacterium]
MGFSNGESDEGGFEEFVEFCFSCASRSAIRANAVSNALRNSTTNDANSSYEGCGSSDMAIMIHPVARRINSPRRPKHLTSHIYFTYGVI